MSITKPLSPSQGSGGGSSTEEIVAYSKAAGEPILLNGDFSLWEAGTLFSPVADGDKTAIGFQVRETGSMVASVVQDNISPASFTNLDQVPKFSYYSRIDVAQASIGAGDKLVCCESVLEGDYAAKLYYRPFTVNLALKSSEAGVYSFYIQNHNRTESFVHELNVAVGVNYFQISVPAIIQGQDVLSGKDEVGLYMGITQAAGVNYQSTEENLDTWQAGDIIAGPNQTNNASVTNQELIIGAIWPSPIETTEISPGVFDVTPPFRLYDPDEAQSRRKRQYQFYSSSSAAIGVNSASLSFVINFEKEMVTVPNETLLDNSVAVVRPGISNYTSSGSVLSLDAKEKTYYTGALNGFSSLAVAAGYIIKNDVPFIEFDSRLG